MTPRKYMILMEQIAKDKEQARKPGITSIDDLP